MSGLQLMVLAGALVLGGLSALVLFFAPAEPHLGDALARISTVHTSAAPRAQPHAGPPADLTERVGALALRLLPAGVWVRTPARELALLRRSLVRFYGEKVLFALLPPVAVPLLTWLIALTVPLPVTVPVVATLACSVGMWFLPNYNAIDDAKRARADFNRGLGAYIDLVALERNSGSGPRQAMEIAAQVGDSWVFRRLSEELARSRWSGLAPWDALHKLADELGLPDLDDLADIMRLSGEEGAQVYKTLRARSASIRQAMLTAEQGKANEVAERMVIPASLLGVVFVAILVGPAILRLLNP